LDDYEKKDKRMILKEYSLKKLKKKVMGINDIEITDEIIDFILSNVDEKGLR
jgi:hypothetical protein